MNGVRRCRCSRSHRINRVAIDVATRCATDAIATSSSDIDRFAATVVCCGRKTCSSMSCDRCSLLAYVYVTADVIAYVIDDVTTADVIDDVKHEGRKRTDQRRC